MSSLVFERPLAQETAKHAQQTKWRSLTVVLVICDALTLVLALGLAYIVRFYTNLAFFEDVQPPLPLYAQLALLIIPCWLGTLALFRLYNIRNLLGGTREYAKLFNACAVAICLIILLTFFVPFVRLSRAGIVLAWLFAFVLLSLERFTLRRVVYRLRRRGHLMSRTLIIGTDGEARAIAQQIQSTPTIGAQVMGFVEDGNGQRQKLGPPLHVLGTIENLPDLVERLGIEELIVSLAAMPREDVLTIFQTFAQSDRVALRFSSGMYELFTAGMTVSALGRVPLFSINKVQLDPVEAAVKTVLDKVLSFIALALLFPVFCVLVVLVKLDSPGPVIHRRRVLGHAGQVFDAFKFRTMYVNGADLLAQHPELEQELQTNHKLRNDPRITPLGRWLRRLSLDELPQLLNILFGQMSLVGPRMISPEEATMYGQWQMNLLTVKPGLTGMWQVKGRSKLSYEERVRLDMYYICNYSLWLDLQIMLQTVPVVFSGAGAF